MNDSVDYRLVEEIFLDALELPPDERAALLSERCASHPALLDEVESLLASHEGPGIVPDLEEERPFGGRYPERIGPYRIVRPLGEGGMGVVLLAIREGAGFEQTVALKVLRGTVPDPMLARRLEEERRILAGLEHPGIARFVDGGMTEAAEPFYAMEYVQGQDILAYCDEHGLDVEARLALFIEVCEAVNHAHQQLVVHRDLKPSNIMVTPEGRPKLLDFGIAKNLGGVVGAEQTARWITTAYASPEQIRGNAVTTLSDVYALGVLLCELLTGRRPYETSGLSLEELTRVVLHDAPRRPSDLVAPKSRLARQLRGDVDLMVAKALAKEPARRYDSARALADDVDRYLRGLPLHARPDSAAYRFGKFYRRHRVAVAAAAAMILALVGGTGGVIWQARVATAERVRAEVEAARARQVTELMTDIFRLNDPTQSLGDTVGVHQVLREGVERVDRSLADDPVLQATLLMELARVYRNLGLLDRGAELAGRVRDLRERNEPRSLAYADALGFHGLVLRDAGRLDEAMTELEEALSLRDQLVPAGDTVTAGLLEGLAREIRVAGDYERARGLFQRALQIRRSALGNDDPSVATAMLGVASTFHDEGAFDAAEDLFRQAIERGDAGASPVAATAMVNLGMLRRLREEYAEAEPLLEAAYDMRLSLLGREHPETLEAAEQLGAGYTALGRYAEAEQVLGESLDIAIRTLGESHERTRSLREGLASVDHALGRYSLALARTDSVITAKIAAHDGDHPGVVYSLVESGDILRQSGDLDGAQSRYEEALLMGTRLGGNEGVYGMLAREGQARVALDQGRLGAADSLLAAAFTIASETLRDDHRYVLDLRKFEARLALTEGRPGEAGALLSDVLERERAIRPSPHPRIGEVLSLLAEASAGAGDVGRAQSLAREAAAEFAALPAGHPDRAATERLLARPGG